jgi:molybdopterin-guanine dinucleotide biosynthesis adapter protein
MKPIVITVVGGKKSGKTTTIEVLIRHLSKRGFRIAAVKHIPEPDFTIDEEGKDTWRYAKSGATTIIGVSEHEIATIEKIDFREGSLTKILKKCSNCELIFLEGFKGSVAKNKNFHKIVMSSSEQQAAENLNIFEPILAFVGSYNPKASREQPPHFDILKNPDELADLIEKLVIKRKAT